MEATVSLPSHLNMNHCDRSFHHTFEALVLRGVGFGKIVPRS